MTWLVIKHMVVRTYEDEAEARRDAEAKTIVMGQFDGSWFTAGEKIDRRDEE